MWPFKKRDEVPTMWDLENAFVLSEFTPDIAVLQQKETQLLFVCDEMQRGHPRFDLIEEHSVPMGVAFSKDDFVMYKRKLGEVSYGIVLDAPLFHDKKGPIRGELYAVQSPHYNGLDTFYQNGLIFERRRVTVSMPYTHFGKKADGGGFVRKATVDIRCFMYVGIFEHWQKMIAEEEEGFFLFDRVQMFTPNNPDKKPYYNFTKMEYEP